MDESLDSLPFGDLKLLQAKNGYRYSLDPILLARFVRNRRWERVVDLGTGSGVLPLVLARIGSAGQLIGIERQQSLADRAVRNVALNQLDGRVRIEHGDLRNIAELLEVGSADLVVTNPPFRPVGAGRVAPDDERAAARHELAGGLSDFVVAAAWLLKFGGCFCAIHLAERLPDLIMEMRQNNLEPKRLRMVHAHGDEGARLVLIEGRKGGRPGLEVERSLYIYRSGGSCRDYSDEVLQMYSMSTAADLA